MKNTYTEAGYRNLSFANNLYKKEFLSPTRFYIENNKTYTDNNVNEYYLNELKFRDKRDWELGKPTNIVALGCSHTYGFGVPQEYTWPSIIESRTGKTVSNLGICGASANTMLESLLLYLENVGIPEYVFACFATHVRYTHIIDGKFYKIDNAYSKEYQPRKVISHLRTSDIETGEINMQDKIFKFPGNAEYLIPTEESIHQFISSIYTIEKICKFLNIKFYWGSWYRKTTELFTRNLFLKNTFCLNKNNHVAEIDFNSTEYEYSYNSNSHHEKKCESIHLISDSDFEKYKYNMWLIGSDNSHFGIHWQYHTAESFMKRIK